ncbi:cytochrome P450 [Umbelopsis sp. AD052]|nr:cytochrome P450 [Umbelopsis sp. AD052]
MNQLEQLRQWLPSTEKVVKAAEENRQAVAVTAGVVSLVGAVHLYRKKRSAPKLQGKSINSLPGPDSLPIFGHSLQFKMDELNAFTEAISWKYGEMAQMFIGPMRVVLASSPQAVEKLFRERPNNFKRSFNVEKEFQNSGVPGLFSMEGDDWRHSRAWLFPQFAPGKINKTKQLIIKHATSLRKSLDLFSKEVEEINNKWYPSVEQDPNTRYTKTNFYDPAELKNTIDIFSSFAFGVVIDFSFAHDKEECLPENILEDIKVIFTVMRRRLFQIVPWHKIGFRDADDRKFDETVAKLNQSVQNIIEDYDPNAYKEKSDKMSTMLESLWYSLNHQDINKIETSGLLSASKAASKMSIKDMVGNLLTVISAGYDTTANTMQTMVYLLAANPDVQQKLHAEVDAILGSPSARRQMSSDETSEAIEENVFAQFPYTSAIINETQRLHPVAPFAGVEAIHDTVVDGYVLPKGTNIMVLTRVAAMRCCPTPDPFLFKPERWIDSTPEQKKQMERLDWTFGGGPRVCPGRHMANLELIYAAVLVISLYDITEVARPPSAYPVMEGARFTSMLENVHVRFTPRT